jgi:hypothetical protein
MAEINYNERTGQPEYWNNATNQWTAYNPDEGAPPETTASSLISLEDIKKRTPFSRDVYGTLVADPTAQAPTDPNEYYKQLASELAKQSYGLSSLNQDASEYSNLIEGLKEVDPKAYYQAKIDLLGRGVGHNVQSNEGGRADIVKKQLEALIPEAQKAGLTPEEINATYGSGYSLGRQGFANILNIQQQEQQGFLAPLIEGIKFVGPGLLGMYGIDAALTAGLGAGYGALSGMSSTGIGSGLGTAAELSGVLSSGAGSLGAGSLGSAGALSTAELLGSTGFTPTAGSSFAIDPTAAYTVANAGTAATQALPYTEAYDAFNLAKQGLNSAAIEQNLAATGLDSFLSADMANLAAQGLSPEAIAQNLAYSYSPAELAGTGIESLQAANTGSSLLSKAGDVLKGAQVAKGLLGVGKNPLQPQSQPQMQMQGGRQYAGVDYSPILNLLNIQQPQRNRNSLLG